MLDFQKNVFINCPFDKEYLPLLRCLLFTTIYCKLNPRIAIERFDSGEVRFEKIKELILESQMSIHDLSRSKASKKGEYYRLNMPFEIGIDLGCKQFHYDEKYRLKKMLILENERYIYQKSLSDLSNSDIKCHNNEPEDLVYEVRNWYIEIGIKVEAGSKIWSDFNEFEADFYLERKKEGYSEKDFEKMPIKEYIDFVKDWCNKRVK